MLLYNEMYNRNIIKILMFSKIVFKILKYYFCNILHEYNYNVI